MTFTFDENGPIWLVGGTGVVGRALAPLLADSGSPLVLAARSAERAAPVLTAVRAAGGDAEFQAFDLSFLDRRAWKPPATQSSPRAARAIVGLLNDPEDRLLVSAVAGGVPFVDITRWTSRVATAAGRLVTTDLRSPVVLSSSWMGGLLPRMAAYLAAELGQPLRSVTGSVRYALADASGEDSVDYMDRLWIPFDATRAGRTETVLPLGERRAVDIAGQRTIVRRIDTPEQWSLPFTLGVESAAVRIGFDSSAATTLLALLARIGFYRRFRAPKYRRLRHSTLRATGSEKRPGAPAAFRVDVESSDGHSAARSVQTTRGQAFLTAVGAKRSLEQALRLARLRRAGVTFPEQDPENAHIATFLEDHDVGVDAPATN